MHLADLASYAATQSRVSALYADRQGWGRKAILNVARSGKFSSDRTIARVRGIDLGGDALSRSTGAARPTRPLTEEPIMAGRGGAGREGLGGSPWGSALVLVMTPGCSPKVGAAGRRRPRS